MKLEIKYLVFLMFLFATICCKDKKVEQVSVEKTHKELESKQVAIKASNFKSTIDGKEVALYTITNKKGLSATFTNYGQRLVSLYTNDKNGNFKDIVLGFSNLEDYINSEEKYFGATIGRYGNRIAKGEFLLDGKAYKLIKNNGANHLHGGIKGFHNVVWDVTKYGESELEFSRISLDGEEGYPGNLNVKVHYLLTDENELQINYEAETDKETIINLTHHSFFNLNGEGIETINNHILTINADHFTPVDSTLIPTGEIRKVDNTPFDFRNGKPINKHIDLPNEQLSYGKGYDHNFVLNDLPKREDGLVFAAKVVEPNSGRVLEVFTSEPGLQFYGGNFLNGKIIGKRDKPYIFRSAFCLESQHFPDSPNNSDFPSTILKPNEKYISTCIYKFSTINQSEN